MTDEREKAGQHEWNCPANPNRTVCTAQLKMSEAPELPPLPYISVSPTQQIFTTEEMHAYGRACQAQLLAEIERQQEEIRQWYGEYRAAERMCDELRAKLEAICPDGTAAPSGTRET